MGRRKQPDTTRTIADIIAEVKQEIRAQMSVFEPEENTLTATRFHSVRGGNFTADFDGFEYTLYRNKRAVLFISPSLKGWFAAHPGKIDGNLRFRAEYPHQVASHYHGKLASNAIIRAKLKYENSEES